MSRRIRRAAALTSIVLSTLLVTAACGSDSHDAASHSSMAPAASAPPASAPAVNTSGAEGDVMFATMMIPHHQQAVEMADLALARSGASPFVTELATQIKAAQQPEIDEMTAWLTEWGAPVPGQEAAMDEHAGHGMAGMMTPEQMGALEAAEGPAFDQLWLEMMIEHHQGAIAMAEEVLATTQDDRVRALAQAVIAGQQQEIERMQAELG